MKRIYLVLFVLYIKNSISFGTSTNNNSFSRNENNPQWYSKGKSISRESYVEPTASQSQQPQLTYPTSFDNGGSEYNSVVPSPETSKYFYKIYPHQNQQQPHPYYQQASNNFQQYPSAYGQPPDTAANKQSFLDGLGLGNLGSSLGLGGGGGGLSSLFGGGDGGGGLGGLGSGLQGLTGGLGNGLQGLTGGLGGFGGGGGDSYGVGGGDSFGIGDTAGAGVSGIGSLAGPAVAGLFGLKGLKGLGIIGTGILLFVLGPVLLILIAFPIAMITLGILAFPVLQLRLPPDGNVRSLKTSLKDTARFARDVLQSEECVERLSCTIANYTRSMPLQNWLTGKLERSQNKWLHRVSRSVKVATAGQDCLQFTCTPASHIRKMFRSYVFGEAKKLN